MVLILVILLAIVKISEEQVYLIGPSKTLPQYFPYHAYVKSDLYCLGALISTRYVLVNAICIETRKKAKVYLGTLRDPFYSGNDMGQVIRSTELIPHPQFSKRYNDKLLVNNIGLVKLLDSAIVTPTVRPILLPRIQDFPLRPGTLVNITGYLDSLFASDVIHFMTVKVRPQTDCYMLFGNSMIKDDEQCIEGVGTDRLDWPGAVAQNGRIVGMARVLSREAECLISTPTCSPRDVFLTLAPYLDWIYENTDIPRRDVRPPSNMGGGLYNPQPGIRPQLTLIEQQVPSPPVEVSYIDAPNQKHVFPLSPLGGNPFYSQSRPDPPPITRFVKGAEK